MKILSVNFGETFYYSLKHSQITKVVDFTSLRTGSHSMVVHGVRV